MNIWFTDYKWKIPIRGIAELCDAAQDLQTAKEIVERGLNRNFVHPLDFMRMKSAFRLVLTKYLSIIRGFMENVDEKSQKDYSAKLGQLTTDLENLIKWGDSERTQIGAELKGGPQRSYSWIPLWLDNVNTVLYSYILEVLNDAVNYNKVSLMTEFVVSSFSRRGLVIDPMVFRAEEKIKLKGE